MMLFSHWLFWLKNWSFSTDSWKGFIVSLNETLKVGHSLFKNICFIFTSVKVLYKWLKSLFWFHAKSSFSSRDIHIFVLSFSNVEKRLDKKALLNFKDWASNNYSTHIAQVSQEAESPRQWNLVSQWNITREIFFLKNQIQDVVTCPRPFYRKSKLSICLDH